MNPAPPAAEKAWRSAGDRHQLAPSRQPAQRCSRASSSHQQRSRGHCPAHPPQPLRAAQSSQQGRPSLSATDAPVHSTSSPAAASDHPSHGRSAPGQPLPLRHKPPSQPRAERMGAMGDCCTHALHPRHQITRPKNAQRIHNARTSEPQQHKWLPLIIRAMQSPMATLTARKEDCTSEKFCQAE